jgi:hypothetical protein
MLLHALIPASRANGPGLRTVVFFQGCKVGCVGCWNPRTHPFHGTEIKVDAVAQEGRMLFIATCNSIASLPPELRRRFTLGTFFFDLPTALELVSHLRDQLADQPDGKPQRLRESILQKLRDFLGTFDLRNVVDDQDLKEQVDKARALLEGVSTDALRNMPLIRARVREGMAELAVQMDVLAGDRISRKFRFAEE